MKSCEFVHQTAQNDFYCMLDSEIHLLQEHNISCDGTFRLVAQLESYSQVYIISAIFDMGDGYFYYPFFFGVLGRKDGPTYLRMLRWLKEKYESIHSPEIVAPLEPTRIYADFEMGFVAGVNSIFPSTQVKLCLKHLGTNYDLKCRAIFGTEWKKNRKLEDLGNLFIGSAYCPLETDGAITLIQNEMRRLIRAARVAGTADKTRKYLKYVNFYYKNDGSYRWSNWNYYNVVKEKKGAISTTNGSEGLNAELNRNINKSSNIEQVLQEIKNFKGRQLTKYHDIIHRNKLVTRRADLCLRHQDLYERIIQFESYDLPGRLDYMIEHALYCGWLMQYYK